MFLTLLVYCLVVVLASLAGGYIPALVRLTHTRMQLAMSLVAGLMLGVGMLHMLPHSLEELKSPASVGQWVVGGFLAMFLLQRFFHAHQHVDVDDGHGHAHGGGCQHDHVHDDHGTIAHVPTAPRQTKPDDPAAPPASLPISLPVLEVHSIADHRPHDHAHAHGHHAHHAGAPSPALSWIGAAIGLTLHSTLDGIALAAAVQAESAQSGVGWLAGFGAFLAIVLHKPFDSLAIGTLMQASGWPSFTRHVVNVTYALMTPLGVLLFLGGMSGFDQNQHHLLGIALAFSAGAFICIATSDILPELQFHTHDRVKLTIALLLGVFLAWAIENLSHAGHEGHQHSAIRQGEARNHVSFR